MDDFTLDNMLAFMGAAQQQGYPVMIGESTPLWAGTVEGVEATWHTWFVPYFAFIHQHPTVKAFATLAGTRPSTRGGATGAMHASLSTR